MRLERRFDLGRTRDEVVEMLGRDETLVGLFPDAKTEIVNREGDRVTTRTQYSALGREGVATFHFTQLLDGDMHFEKVCDGVVWKELSGLVSVQERGSGSSLSIELKGSTQSLVPEFAIKGQMAKQLEQMTTSLRERFEAG